ncbi:MAG: amidohydrolase [Spirochaetales bacterium]|nr:amidohydrolase [Spirochaetales bacterium]
MGSILLCGADLLLRHEGRWSVQKRGFLGVRDQSIDYIGVDRPTATYDEEITLGGHLLMPGLYNMHTHTPMTLLRGLGSGLTLDRWLREAIFPVEDRLTPDDIRVGTELALLEMLASGVVSFNDMYYMPEITADAVLSAGMKANLNRPIVGFDKDEPYAKNQRVRESLQFFDTYHKAGNGAVLVDFAIHAEYTSFDELVKPYAADCLARGARMHIHLSETVKEHEECKIRHGTTPTRWFLDMGVLDSPVVAAHCVAVEPEDLDILQDRGVTCVHNPSSNMKLGSGFMPLATMLDRDMKVALGTDGAASNNNLNLFEEMHLAALIHKGHAGDPTIIEPGQLLDMATVRGAAAQGRTNAGELAVGQAADIVAIDLRKPHLVPNSDTLSLLVYSAQASDVAMTMVNGRVLYERGVYHTIDATRVLEEAAACALRLGLPVDGN